MTAETAAAGRVNNSGSMSQQVLLDRNTPLVIMPTSRRKRLTASPIRLSTCSLIANAVNAQADALQDSGNNSVSPTRHDVIPQSRRSAPATADKQHGER